MTLQIIEGRKYVTRGREIVGPIYRNWADSETWPFKSGKEGTAETMWYKSNGYSCPGNAADHRDHQDLVAEHIETPTRSLPTRTVTTTRIEIVPGTYGPIGIMEQGEIKHRVFIEGLGTLNADQLREASSVFLALAAALEQDKA